MNWMIWRWSAGNYRLLFKGTKGKGVPKYDQAEENGPC